MKRQLLAGRFGPDDNIDIPHDHGRTTHPVADGFGGEDA